MNAEITLKQIGTMNLMACGARNFVKGDDFVQFNVERGNLRKVKITLNAADLYDVEWFRLKRGTYEIAERREVNNVFCEDLGETVYRIVNR